MNSASVLRLLRSHGTMSRAALARRSGLNEGSISRITSDLIVRKLLTELGAESSTGGRPGVRLQLSDYKVGIGVEIKNEQMRMAAATLSGKVLHEIRFATPTTPRRVLEAVVKRFGEFRERYRTARIQGLGVSVRGIVNIHSGTVELGSAPHWVSIAVKKTLSERLRIAVDVDNDVRLAAMAEYNYGSLPEVRQSDSLLFAMVDEGIGVGLVLGGKVYCGPSYAAGEFGQMVIRDDGQPPRIDGAGCLETLASNKALCERYASLAGKRRNGSSSVHTRAQASGICQRALAGEKAAVKAVEETCHYLGIGLANMLWGLNSDAVVLDSVLNEAWPMVAPLLESEFPKGRGVVNFRAVGLRKASLTGEASLLGAATMPFQRLFSTGDGMSLSYETD